MLVFTTTIRGDENKFTDHQQTARVRKQTVPFCRHSKSRNASRAGTDPAKGVLFSSLTKACDWLTIRMILCVKNQLENIFTICK